MVTPSRMQICGNERVDLLPGEGAGTEHIEYYLPQDFHESRGVIRDQYWGEGRKEEEKGANPRVGNALYRLMILPVRASSGRRWRTSPGQGGRLPRTNEITQSFKPKEKNERNSQPLQL